MDFDIGVVREVDIEKTMREAYLDYAMSVIVARALPDVRDGLKPVQRRILYAMYATGLRHNVPYRKSARVVGEVLGKYHPHGDTAIYDALARMAQDFSLRYPLVDGQGNFGSIDGDSPAAMRYTEARLTSIAEELLTDIEKETVDFVPNFDGSLQEPSALPARIPNLLINGSSGIAVGMATNIPSHNLSEIADAIVFLIDRWHDLDQVTVDDLMQIVPGPDFPTGALIMGREGTRSAYATGRGKITVRAGTEIEDLAGGRHRIVINSIPFQVNKSQLVERIASLVHSGRLDQISDLRDESDREGLRVVVELKRGAPPRKVLNQLFKYTPLETTFGVNMLALVDGTPRLLPLKKALSLFIQHRQEVLERRTRFELRQAKERAHILEGLRIALQFLDEVISIIRHAESAENAKAKLVERFKLSEVQAQAILDMQLRRLAALERQKIEDEYQGLLKRIEYLEGLLRDPDALLQLVREDMLDLKTKYGDERRTLIMEAEGELTEEDLIPQRDILVTITRGMYIKSTPAHSFRSQGRGGRGVATADLREDDLLEHVFSAKTLDHILFFTSLGRVFSLRGYHIPEGKRTSRGTSVLNLLSLGSEEQIATVIPVHDFDAARFIVLATTQGIVKRMRLDEFRNVRPSGLIAANLRKGDSLVAAQLTGGQDELLLVSAQGHALRFGEGLLRPIGRASTGVRGMRLGLGDSLVSACVVCVVEPDALLFLVTANGYGKVVPLSEYPPHGRGTRGVKTISKHHLSKTGPIVAARVVRETDQVLIISKNGTGLRMQVSEMRPMSRGARGVFVIRLREGDAVSAVAVLRGEEPRKPEEETGQEGKPL